MAKRIDGNQTTIVADLRRAGFSVADTHELGDGFGDIVVGAYGLNFIFEIKDPTSDRWVKRQKRQLEGAELDFHTSWNGQIGIIEAAEEGIEIVETVAEVLQNTTKTLKKVSRLIDGKSLRSVGKKATRGKL